MKRIIPYIVLCTLSFCTFSCRPQGDDLLSYGQNDYQAYYDANHTFAGEFKAFWTAMNENYCIWDYEAEFGTDWDQVYTTFLPKFEELDKRQDQVTDEELESLYRAFTDTLHDGHMAFSVKNLHTGKHILLQPNAYRLLRERQQETAEVIQHITTLDTYRTTAVADAYRIRAYDGTGSMDIAFERIDSAVQRALRAADTYIAAVEAAGGPDVTNDSVYYAVRDGLRTDAQKIADVLQLPFHRLTVLKSAVYQSYDYLCRQYAFVSRMVGAPLTEIESDLQDDALGYIRYALFDGNIAYLRLGGFSLSPYMDESTRSKDNTPALLAYRQAVNRVWKNWFDTIQTLHRNGTLGGVIIDVRNNTGGYVSDYQYVLGALLPSGGWDSHTLRMKNGVGRYDFGPLQPFTVPTCSGEHEVVNDRPVVVLANCRSVSMAEITTWGVMNQPNGCFIGARTYGAMSALSAEPENYSDNYSGAFGERNVTPIWAYIPKMVGLFGKEQKPKEGIGLEPDIAVPLDVSLWTTLGRDNQLESALNYIRSK